MTSISESAKLCTVIVTVDGDPSVIEEIKPHAQDGLRRFREFPGFISGSLHQSIDGGRLVQYLQWKTEADHLACMNDPRWEELPSARHFLETIAKRRAVLDVRTYRVEAVAEKRCRVPGSG